MKQPINRNHQDPRLVIFSLTWAIATLFHYQAFHKWAEGYPVWLAAIWLIVNPTQVYRLILLSIFQVGEAFVHLPLKHNHWLLTTLVNLTILLTISIDVIRKRSFRFDQTEIYETFSPYVRVELLILYFYAVFHKLNYDFFNPLYSCGAYFYQTLTTRFTFLPDSQILEVMTLISTLLFEICIPLLLISSRLRNLGILVAFIFHGIIGFNPTSEFWNFSALVYALVILFSPPDFSGKCIDRISRLQIKKYGNVIPWMIFLFGIIVLVIIDDQVFEVRSGLVLWTFYMVLLIVLFIANIGWRRILKEDENHRASIFQFKSYLLFIFPVLTFLNGMSPYLGLKTESSFSMFSNLRTEGGISNHFLISNSWQVFDFQKDLIEIVDSSDGYLNALKKEGLLLPYFELKKYFNLNPNISVIYLRDGKTNTTDNLQPLEKDPWYSRAFLIFRPVSKITPTKCTR